MKLLKKIVTPFLLCLSIGSEAEGMRNHTMGIKQKEKKETKMKHTRPPKNSTKVMTKLSSKSKCTKESSEP